MSHTFTTSKRKIYHIILGIIAFIVVSLFCIMPETSRKEQVAYFSTWLYAHRGLYNNASTAPENSLLAFQQAIDGGYGIEFDVQVTKDGVPVVIHDNNLSKTCSIDEKITELSFNDLCNYTLFDSEETIPSLEAVLNLIHGQVPLMIEIKADLHYKEACQAIDAVLDHYEGDYCIISFNPLVLRWFKRHAPDVLRGQLSSNYFKDHIGNIGIAQLFLSNLYLNFLSKPDFISYNYKYSYNPAVIVCHKFFKAPISAWTVKSDKQYALLKDHYDFLIFDSFLPYTP